MFEYFKYLQQFYKNIKCIVENTKLFGYKIEAVIFFIQYCYKCNIITKAERNALISQISSDFDYGKMLDMIKVAKDNLKLASQKIFYFEVYNPVTGNRCRLHDIVVDTANNEIRGNLSVSCFSLPNITGPSAKCMFFKDLESAEKALQKFKQSNLMIFPKFIDQSLACRLQLVVTDVGTVLAYL